VTALLGGMQRILAGSVNPVLRAVVLDQDGELATLTGPATVAITRADGTVIASARTATLGANIGTITAALTTAEAVTLDVLTAVWAVNGVVRASTSHRVVGGFLFQIRDLAGFAGMEKFDDASRRDERDQVTDLIEEHTGVCWSPTFDRVTFRHSGSTTMLAPVFPVRAVRRLTIDGTVISLTGLEVEPEEGIITGSQLAVAGMAVLDVEHGFTAPDGPLAEAALQAARHRLLSRKSALGDRVRSVTDDMGTRTFGFAGRGHPTGVDDIDAVIVAHDRRRPGIG
jgi:hypothetical protein